MRRVWKAKNVPRERDGTAFKSWHDYVVLRELDAASLHPLSPRLLWPSAKLYLAGLVMTGLPSNRRRRRRVTEGVHVGADVLLRSREVDCGEGRRLVPSEEDRLRTPDCSKGAEVSNATS